MKGKPIYTGTCAPRDPYTGQQLMAERRLPSPPIEGPFLGGGENETWKWYAAIIVSGMLLAARFLL